MRKALPFIAILLVACAQPPSVPRVERQPAASLVRITDGGEFVEVERLPEYSVVEVRSAPAGSVASSMYALRGSCAVARARGESYFSSAPVSASVRTYRLTFPKSTTESQLRGPSKSVFSVAECGLLRF